MRKHGSFKVFAEEALRDFLEARVVSLRSKVAEEAEDYVLNVDEDQYTRYLVSMFSLENLVFAFDRVEGSPREVQVPAEHFSSLFNVMPGRSYPRNAIVYHVPFDGDRSLLGCMPSRRLAWTQEVWTEAQELCFEVIDMSGKPDDIDREAEYILSHLGQQAINVNNEVERYNSDLESQARQALTKRRNEIQAKRGFLASIKVPLRKREGLPDTFTVPSPKAPRKIELRPAASAKPFQPEPTVDETDYREILKVIYDLGKVFERLPATYSGKAEGDLRDHVLLYLEPRFAGTATGETFNRGGKTDILLRHENTNVFVAEFKFWKGTQSAVNAAKQLFSYLTWRDSKVALVIFVKNRAFSSALTSAREAMRSLVNFVRENPPVADTWFDFVFHFPGDSDRHIRVALLLFHLPDGPHVDA